MMKQIITLLGVFALGLMVGSLFWTSQPSNPVLAQEEDGLEALLPPSDSEASGAELMQGKLDELLAKEEEMTDNLIEDADSLINPVEQPTHELVDDILTKFEQFKVDLRVEYETAKEEFANEIREQEEGGSEFVVSDFESEVELRYDERVRKLDIAIQLALGADAKFEESYAVLNRLKDINENLKAFAKKLHNTRVGLEQLNAKLPCSCMSCI